MSSLLKEAIADAAVLKEMALKNAEQLVVEKYSGQIKEAINSILEQDDEEEDLGGDEDLGDLGDLEGDADLGGDEGLGDEGITMSVGGESAIAGDVPLAAAGGEKLCSCPDDDEEIEISFDDLEQQMAQGAAPETLDREEVADEIVPNDNNGFPEPGSDQYEDEDELTDEDLKEALNELLEVDVKPVPSGQLVQNNAQIVDNAEMQLARDVGAPEEEVDEEETTQKKLQTLTEALKREKSLRAKQEKENKALKSSYTELKKLAKEVKDKLIELNNTNARLHYTNRVLKDDSLNEQRKLKIVEALSKAGSARDAKLVFETLQSSMGDNRQSLNEAVNKHNRTAVLLTSARSKVETEEKTEYVPLASRFQKLAGIKRK